MNWNSVLESFAKLNAMPGLSEMCGKLIEWISTKVSSEVSILRGVEQGIEELKRTHRYIQSLLTDAEDRCHIEDETVKQWLLDLQSVGFDADDLIDRYQTAIDISRLAHQVHSRKRKRNGLGGFSVPSPGSYTSLLRHRYSVGVEIANIKTRLEEIKSVKSELRLKPSDGKRRRQIWREPECCPVVRFCDESKIVGRAEDCNSIVVALKSDSEIMLPVIPIYGLAGIGKTTLAQLIFKHFLENDEGGNFLNPKSEDNPEKRKQPVRQGSFELKIWASLPKGCNVTRATREIIEGITKRNCKSSSLNILQHRLNELVEGRKFLLVLDNFWAEEYDFWETLRLPLLGGAKGSKVLITTQNEVVWRAMGVQHAVHLRGLRDGDCWNLLCDQAFPHPSGDDVHEELKKIGMEIVSRCQGSPLAAICIGKILFKNTEAETWRSILDEMWALTERDNQILSSLLVSYHHLVFPMKQCLAYCSVFPNGYEFGKDELVNMWIAEGLVQRKRGKRTLEVIGGRYVDHLLWRSFFESTEHKNKYRIPSLIHDLARHVSEKVMVIIEDNTVIHESCQQPRYATLFHEEEHPVSLDKLFKYKHLRTLKLYGQSRVCVGQIPDDLFVKLKFLRLLDLSNSDIQKLPESVGDLIHLRYLGLAGTDIKQLPESTSKLYNLKTLDLSNCYSFSSLPQETSNLINLRHLDLHLDWDNFNELNSMPPGICHLTSLQTLSRFTVNKNEPGDGCNIGELEGLNLRGELGICKLENIAHGTDAKAAKLNTKEHINKLMLHWSSTLPTSQQGLDKYQEIAEGLQPHTNLTYLCIMNYPGKTFSGWLEDPCFSNLEAVTLSGWQQCDTLPSLGQLRGLKHVHVKKMSILHKLLKNGSDEFPNLRNLSISSKLRKLMKLPPEVELLVE